MPTPWEKLVERLLELSDYQTVLTLLSWDQAVSMPPGGAPARARVTARIEAEWHRLQTAPEIGDLLGELEGDDSLDEMQAATVRELRRDYDKSTKLPPDLVKALAETVALAYQAWTEAKPAADFSVMAPHLEKLFALKKQEADALGWERERYDALLDNYEPQLTAVEMAPVFEELIAGLRPVVDAVLGAAGPRPKFLSAKCDPVRQMDFFDSLVEQLGFDTRGGILAQSPHPFTSHIALGDVRQTTRAQSDHLMAGLYAAIHETGHALYDQGLPEDWVEFPGGRAVSLGIHESQSRMWENQVGRSRPFSEWLLRRLKDRFPEELGTIGPDEFYEGVNHPERTFIRVEADELTYNLHVALRFELERAIYRDDLGVSDLPDAWNQRMDEYVGIRPHDDGVGVLQDMHWSIGYHGYFPTYTLGTLYAAAFFARAKEDLGDLDDDLREGKSERLLQWLRDKIHRHGSRYEAAELSERITGERVSPAPFLDHIRSKYGELYDVSL